MQSGGEGAARDRTKVNNDNNSCPSFLVGQNLDKVHLL